MLPSIALINKTTKKTFREVAQCARSIDWQVRCNLAPAWGFYATVFAAPDAVALPPATWKVFLYDEPTCLCDAGKLGLHRQEGPDCVPLGYVFLGPCERADEPWTGIASHEVVEMLGDPWINLEVRRGVELWARELCDAVQGQYYRTPLVDGVEVANFVYPEYFVEESNGPFDHLGTLKSAFDVAPTGYALVTKAGNTTARYGEGYPSWRRNFRPASRRSARQENL